MSAANPAPVRCTSCPWTGNRDRSTLGELPCPKCGGAVRAKPPKIPATPRASLARVSAHFQASERESIAKHRRESMLRAATCDAEKEHG